MSASDTYAIAFAASRGWSPARTLSAIGHPGYSSKFAALVLAEMASTGCSAHRAIATTYHGQR